MITINLLPQEDAPRTRSIKLPKVGAMVPVAAAAAVLLLCTTMFFVQQRKHDDLVRQVELAKEESRKLAPQIARIKQLQREREQLDARLDAITELDRDRYLRVHLMSELSRRLPENSWITRLEESSPGTVEVDGITFNNFIVADFLADLAQSEYVHGVDLVKTTRGMIEEVAVMEFQLSAIVGQPGMQVAAAPAAGNATATTPANANRAAAANTGH